MEYTIIKNGDYYNPENKKEPLYSLYTVIYRNPFLSSFYFIDGVGLNTKNLVVNKMKEKGYSRYYTFEFDAELKNIEDFVMFTKDPKEVLDLIDERIEDK